jgi:hypothetical protein
MQLSNDEQELAALLKRALAQAEALSLGLVAISISTAIDHLEQATGQRIHFPPSEE